jgi:hypothetical protein
MTLEPSAAFEVQLFPHEVDFLTLFLQLLSLEQAALYTGVSSDTFLFEVRSGIWPQPIKRGAKGTKLTWDKAALDASLDRMSGLQNASATTHLPDTDQWEERLNGPQRHSQAQARRNGH